MIFIVILGLVMGAVCIALGIQTGTKQRKVKVVELEPPAPKTATKKIRQVRDGLVRYEKRGHDYLLTIMEGGVEKQFIGLSTVWHSFPNFKRCGTYRESDLSDICKKIQYEEKYGKV